MDYSGFRRTGIEDARGHPMAADPLQYLMAGMSPSDIVRPEQASPQGGPTLAATFGLSAPSENLGALYAPYAANYAPSSQSVLQRLLLSGQIPQWLQQ